MLIVNCYISKLQKIKLPLVGLLKAQVLKYKPLNGCQNDID